MHPGRGHRHRFYPPVVEFGPVEVQQLFPLTLVGPVNEHGTFAFDGTVTLTPCIRPDLPRAYLFLLKVWDGAPPRPQSERWIASATDFATEMRNQELRVVLDKFATGRLYWTRTRATWGKLVGQRPQFEIDAAERLEWAGFA